VLGIVITAHIYETYPDLQEGSLAKLRAALVNSNTLAELAAELGLGAAMRLGKGEDASGGREKPSILADALEAVIGAVFVDGGIDAATGFVLALFTERIEEAAEGPEGHDAKTRLQEWAAQHVGAPPRYEMLETGPDHSKLFEARLYLGERCWGQGEGRSKKQAEQQAARAAWTRIEDGELDGNDVEAASDQGGPDGDAGSGDVQGLDAASSIAR
jgi:ribonuclease III